MIGLNSKIQAAFSKTQEVDDDKDLKAIKRESLFGSYKFGEIKGSVINTVPGPN